MHLICRAIVATALVACSYAAQAQQQEQCGPADSAGIQKCRAAVVPDDVQRMAAVQERRNWCWAASMSMIFAHHGYQMPQEQIAREQYADAADRGARPQDISRMLDQTWQDAHGRSFVASSVAGSEPGRRFQFGNDTVIRELIAQRPLIIGTLGHAMVLVAVEYERFTLQDAVRITGGTVIDPWPQQGVRPLRPAELSPGYVAAVHVNGTLAAAPPAGQQAIAAAPTIR
jgi:Papain-like cysteine protease AvrRpt2